MPEEAPALIPAMCDHPNLPAVPFDPIAAKGLTADEVRKRWPRLALTCPDCGMEMCCYASFEHYVSGDW